MSTRSEPEPPADIRRPNLRLRSDQFEAYCIRKGIAHTDVARAEFIRMSRPQLRKICRYGAAPGSTFIASCLVALGGKHPGKVFEDLFEIVTDDDEDRDAAA